MSLSIQLSCENRLTASQQELSQPGLNQPALGAAFSGEIERREIRIIPNFVAAVPTVGWAYASPNVPATQMLKTPGKETRSGLW